jgi:hypothetical protein
MSAKKLITMYNKHVTRKLKLKLSLIGSFISFLALFLLVSLTSPVENIGLVLIFFAVLLVFLVSLGHLLVYLRQDRLGPKTRSRIVIFSVFIVLLLMFGSSQSMSWVEGLILLLVFGGLLFYSSRRA